MTLAAADARNLIDPVLATGRTHHPHDIKCVLNALRRLCDADACILWLWTEQVPASQSRLFAAAEDFEPVEGQAPEPFWHYLMPNSPTTRVVREGRPRNFLTLPLDEMTPGDPDTQAIARLGIQRYCAIPVWWPNAQPQEKAIGAVVFYRRSERAFTGEAFDLAKTLAPLVPHLLDDLINHASFHVLRRASEVLRAATTSPEADLSSWPPSPVIRTLDSVLAVVQETLHCLECSVYMIKPDVLDGALHLVSTIWPWKDRAQPEIYGRAIGLTGYCADRTMPLCIFDLGRFREDIEFIRLKYPGIQWSLPFDITDAAREVLPKTASGRLPPLSFLAAPIPDYASGGSALGVLRCCVSREAPYYFNERQLDLLCLVAGLVGEWCSGYLRLKRVQEQRRWLQSYVRGISALNGRAHEAAVSHKPDLALFPKALEAAEKAVPGASGLALHLVAPDAGELRLAGVSGPGWNCLPAKEVRRSISSIPVKDFTSPTARAFAHNKVILASEFGPSGDRLSFFPEAACAVAAPISSGSKQYGVFTVAFTAPGALSEEAVAVAELLGRQLGLYLFLGETISELRSNKEQLERTVQVQQEAFENLNHQLKTPVFLAHRAARRLLERRGFENVPEVPRLKGQLRRAEQVVSNIRMFYDLARGRPIHATRAAVRPPKLLDRIAETVRGHTLFSLDPSRGMRFVLADDSLRSLEQANAAFWLDLDLLDQALDDLLDNAEKYGDPNTTVMVRAGVTARGQFLFVSVANSGRRTPVSPQQGRTIAERGRRGDTAIWQGSEGSGIGLYIVREILSSHGGRLEILPTNDQGITEFRLLFPTGVPEGQRP